MAELAPGRHSSLWDDMVDYIDQMNGPVEKLRAMTTECNEANAVGIRVVSIEATDLLSIKFAFNNLNQKDLQWRATYSSLIDKVKALKSGSGYERNAAASFGCSLCRKTSQEVSFIQ